jgi:hypothetical protein
MIFTFETEATRFRLERAIDDPMTPRRAGCPVWILVKTVLAGARLAQGRPHT